jgi:hypothetical protein
MKANFRRFGLAVAVATASASLAGLTYAQGEPEPEPEPEPGFGPTAISDNGLGDLAVIPYYTVKNGFTTGFVVTNTSDRTQVVKVRLRRAADSMDALDINVVMSPKDVWAANISDEDGTIYLSTDDNSCTIPKGNAGTGRFVMSPLYNATGDAEEGYIEIIGMGSPLYQVSSSSEFDEKTFEKTAVAVAAEHDDDGVPDDCDLVEQNFFSQNFEALEAEGVAITEYGNLDAWRTEMQVEDDDGDDQQVQIVWGDTNNVIRASYLIRDKEAGLEFGNEALHIRNFLQRAAMTNQQYGLFAGDVSGFDYPDLNGGAPRYVRPAISAGDETGLYGLTDGNTPPQGVAIGGLRRGKFNNLRDAMGVDAVLNDWSTNPANGVATDWVVTFPGQYTMFDYYMNNSQLFGTFECGEDNPDEDLPDIPECDFRDLPVRASFSGNLSSGTWDREEQSGPRGEGGLVVSPSIPGQSQATDFEYEVNVVEWSDGSGADPVLGSDYAVSVDSSVIGVYGWAQLSVVERNSNPQKICDLPLTGAVDYGSERPVPQLFCDERVNPGIPMTGFVAWQRSFPETPDRNYGRIVEHAWISSLSAD